MHPPLEAAEPDLEVPQERHADRSQGHPGHAACRSPPDSSGRSTSWPFLKRAPAWTRACGAASPRFHSVSSSRNVTSVMPSRVRQARSQLFTGAAAGQLQQHSHLGGRHLCRQGTRRAQTRHWKPAPVHSLTMSRSSPRPSRQLMRSSTVSAGDRGSHPARTGKTNATTRYATVTPARQHQQPRTRRRADRGRQPPAGRRRQTTHRIPAHEDQPAADEPDPGHDLSSHPGRVQRHPGPAQHVREAVLRHQHEQRRTQTHQRMRAQARRLAPELALQADDRTQPERRRQIRQRHPVVAHPTTTARPGRTSPERAQRGGSRPTDVPCGSCLLFRMRRTRGADRDRPQPHPTSAPHRRSARGPRTVRVPRTVRMPRTVRLNGPAGDRPWPCP